MRVATTTAELGRVLEAARRRGRSVGLVPTMGALHAGHRSLIGRAAADCDEVAVSIFVNPLQFGDVEDLRGYPRTLEHDLATCEASGASVVFAPTVAEMYPRWPAPLAATVRVGDLGDRWEGASRPGHFDGVATVVAKLFAMVGACRAYFGEKDFQQLVLVRRMAEDLSFPVQVIGCPIVREDDGLALSSRNVRLCKPERRAAAVLFRALEAGCSAVEAGETRPDVVAEEVAAVVRAEPAAHLDYAAVVSTDRLVVPGVIEPEQALRLLVAARLGAVRLIDNCDPRLGVTGCPSAVGGAPPQVVGHEGRSAHAAAWRRPPRARFAAQPQFAGRDGDGPLDVDAADLAPLSYQEGVH